MMLDTRIKMTDIHDTPSEYVVRYNVDNHSPDSYDVFCYLPGRDKILRADGRLLEDDEDPRDPVHNFRVLEGNELTNELDRAQNIYGFIMHLYDKKPLPEVPQELMDQIDSVRRREIPSWKSPHGFPLKYGHDELYGVNLIEFNTEKLDTLINAITGNTAVDRDFSMNVFCHSPLYHPK